MSFADHDDDVPPDTVGLAGALRGLRRSTFGLRLVLGYAVFFVGGVVVLAGLAYVLMLDFMRDRDQVRVQSRLEAYASVYESEGLQALRTEVETDAMETKLLVQVIGAEGVPRYRFNTTSLRPSALNRIRKNSDLVDGGKLRLEANGGSDDAPEGEVEIASRILAEGDRLQVGLAAEPRSDILGIYRWAFLGIALPMILLGIVGSVVVAVRSFRPLRKVLNTVETIIDTGDVEERVAVDQAQGEFAELARLFNRMLDRIEGLVNQMRDTLDQIAHDLRTPMTHLRGRAEMALQPESNVEPREALSDVVESADRVLAILNTAMEVAEAGPVQLEREPLSVDSLVGDVVTMYEVVARERELSLEVEIEDRTSVYVDPSSMQQALANLVDNAVTYTPEGGRVVVEAETRKREVVIRVRDNGPGILAEDLPHVWDRLYRGTPPGHEGDTEGLGLGLSLVQAVVEAHGGTVEIESEPGEGTTVLLRLPVREKTLQTTDAYKTVRSP